MSRIAIKGTDYLFSPETLEIVHRDLQLHDGPSKTGAGKGRGSFSIQLMVTLACNLSCQYCFGKTGNGAHARMDDNMVAQVAEFVRRTLDNYQRVSVNFFGGEPLLNRPAIERLVDELRDCPGIVYAITTNGVLLDEAAVKMLKEWGAEVCVSLDGPRHIHDARRRTKDGRGSFDAAHEGLLRAVDAGLTCGVECVVSLDKPHLVEQHEFLRNLPVKYIRMPNDFFHRHPFSSASAEDYIDQLEVTRKRYVADLESRRRDCYSFTLGHCYGSDSLLAIHNMYRSAARCAKHSCAITPDGLVARCAALSGTEEFCRGSVSDACLKAESIGTSQACRQCWAQPLCGGTCDYEGTLYRNRGNWPDEELCRVYRALCEASLRTYIDIRERAWEVLAYFERPG